MCLGLPDVNGEGEVRWAVAVGRVHGFASLDAGCLNDRAASGIGGEVHDHRNRGIRQDARLGKGNAAAAQDRRAI